MIETIKCHWSSLHINTPNKISSLCHLSSLVHCVLHSENDYHYKAQSQRFATNCLQRFHITRRDIPYYTWQTIVWGNITDTVFDVTSRPHAERRRILDKVDEITQAGKNAEYGIEVQAGKEEVGKIMDELERTGVVFRL
jgi:hypothetical protein